jgi:hypothetical protein
MTPTRVGNAGLENGRKSVGMRVRAVVSVTATSMTRRRREPSLHADIGTALSGGLIGCIALAQVPNDGHRRYSRWMSSMFAMSSLSSDFTYIASAPEGAGGGSGAGADERLVVKNV